MYSVRQIKEKVDSKKARFELSLESYHKTKKRLKQTERELENTIKAQEICQLVASTIQQRAHDKVAKVVSHCLEAVFEEPYRFLILFKRKMGRTTAELVFRRNNCDINPMDASGGGVIDVASFALRLSCMLLNKPALRRVLILDEPFRFVSEEYQDRVANMLRQLSKDLKVQIIMVTHNEKYQVGKIIRL